MPAPLFSLTLPDGRRASTHGDTAEGVLQVGDLPALSYRFDGERVLIDSPLPAHYPATALLAVIGSHFAYRKKSAVLSINLKAPQAFAVAAIRQGVFDTQLPSADGSLELQCRRATFWQNPLPWLTAPASMHTTLHYCFSGEKRHPQRPPIPAGEVYRRHLPGLNSTFSLRTIDPDRDLEAFNRWMNLEQVAYFWEQTGSLEEHAAYLREMLDDPRVHPLIGCFDDEPFAYFEVYWCKEDRIAPFYDVADYDRGWHVVVGESKHQGVGKLKAWFNSLMHYMYLDDPRTQRILGEPRIDHTRQIEFLKSQGFGHLKDIQFMHKKAALLRLEREYFFERSL